MTACIWSWSNVAAMKGFLNFGVINSINFLIFWLAWGFPTKRFACPLHLGMVSAKVEIYAQIRLAFWGITMARGAHGSLFGSKLKLGLGLALALCCRVEGASCAVEGHVLGWG